VGVEHRQDQSVGLFSGRQTDKAVEADSLIASLHSRVGPFPSLGRLYYRPDLVVPVHKLPKKFLRPNRHESTLYKDLLNYFHVDSFVRVLQAPWTHLR
jgi:hypothetical protein